jgi:hypothetical protein
MHGMGKLQAAHDFIDSAEKQLRELIARAAADGDYVVISQLVEAAEGLRRTTKLLEGAESIRAEQSAAPQAVEPAAAPAPASAPQIEPVRRMTKEYPRFERQGDRLIKVGWSKKDRAEYEHRTDKEIASAVSLYLAERPKDQTFRMDDLLPIEIEDNEVPLYQAYLVLAWLRDRGLITKQGKDGYQWRVGDFDEPAFEAAWGSTPRRD